MLRLQCVQGLAKEEGEGGPGEVCLTIAAAAVPEAAEVRLLEDPVGFAAALHKGASTRSQQKRVRKPVDRCGGSTGSTAF